VELRHLRYFVAVAEAGSFTHAAERHLHTAQPSLSRQIRELEMEVGVKLLERKARGVALTAAGRVFLDHIRLALLQVDAKKICITLKPEYDAENLSAAMSLVASTGGFTLFPLYVQNMLTRSVVTRPLRGEPPTIDLVLGANESNASPVLARFLARGAELVERVRVPQRC
jgi:DNA-binding transcriptional LysR family regulator